MRIPREAFESLANLFERVEAEVANLGAECKQDGACCRFAQSGLHLYATRFEVAYLVLKGGEPEGDRIHGQCPYQQGTLCKAREGRPLGCRVYFCDDRYAEEVSSLYERFHKEIMALHQRHEIEYHYQELLSHSVFC